MTLATWFKFPNADMSQPGVVETVFGPGNGGGDRLFTNNFNGQDAPGTSALDTSDVDDLGHFQIDIGGAKVPQGGLNPLHSVETPKPEQKPSAT